MATSKRKSSTVMITASNYLWDGSASVVEWTMLMTDPLGGPTEEFGAAFPLACSEDVVHLLSELHAFGGEVDHITHWRDVWDAIDRVKGRAVPVDMRSGTRRRSGKPRTWASRLGTKPWRPKKEHLREIRKGFGLETWDESGAQA
jgi:hypothetical protein